jgi:hypothetical protein
MRHFIKNIAVALLTFIIGVIGISTVAFVSKLYSIDRSIGCNGPETGYVPSSMNPNERYEVVPATETEKAHWVKYCSGVRVAFDAPCPYPENISRSSGESGR